MRRFQRQTGAALVEFAIIVTLLLTLAFGIISYGIMMYDQAVLTNAARTGVRAGIVYAVSGNGLTGYTTFPSVCSATTNTAIFTTATSSVKTVAESTARCAANNALVASRLISFGGNVKPQIPLPTYSGTCSDASGNGVPQTCQFTVKITYNYVGLFGVSSPLTASAAMYYE